MDVLTLSGIILALVAIAGGQYIDGGEFSALLNGPALLIVLGGTLGAVMVQSPIKQFLHAFKILSWVIRPPKYDNTKITNKLLLWSRATRKDGLLALEKYAEIEQDPFTRKGVEVLTNGCNANSLRRILELEIESNEMRDLQAAHVFESMGGYSPTIGIIGAVIGLIEVMRNLTEPSEIGAGVAVAFVATIYGVGLANLFFIPIAHKLKNTVRQKIRCQEMILEGLLAIAQGDHPRVIATKLQSFSHAEKVYG